MSEDQSQITDGEGLEDVETALEPRERGSAALIPDEEHRLREKDGTVMPAELQLTREEKAALDDDRNWKGHLMQRAQKPHVQFTDEKKVRFCELLARYGVKHKCAKAVGVSAYTVTRHEQQDQDFKEAVALAVETFADMVEETVIDRAVHGWDEPVYSQKLGIRIGTIRKFDNRLLEMLLKRHRPQYRDKQQMDVNVSGGVLVAPALPPSTDEWRERHLPQADEPAKLPAVEDREQEG